MGCCFSTGDRRPKRVNSRCSGGVPPPTSTSPPPAPEEETVKEVLSETPIVPKADKSVKGLTMGDQQWNVGVESTAVIRGNVNPNPERKADGEIEIVSEVSELSEMCSYSESFSATARERRDEDEDGVVNQRPRPRKRRAPGGGRGTGERAPIRRAGAPSPEKRRQVSPLRAVRGRPMAAQPRNVADEHRRQRDADEGSRRRSMSPERRGGEVDVRRNASEEKSPATDEPPAGDAVPAEEAESLENPVVSLECFIFL